MGLIVSDVFANGTETLGPPLGVSLADGSGILAAGTGMVAQPGMITLEIPSGATVKQVLLYWDGQSVVPDGGDDTIEVNGTEIMGDLTGGPAFFFDICTCSTGCCLTSIQNSSYRADITSLNLVKSGPNTLSVAGMSFNHANNGAGILVIYDDGANVSEIQVRDGLDLAFVGFPEPRKSTVPQTFNFAPSGVDRIATLSLFVGSVHDDRQTETTDRPNSIEVLVTFNGSGSPMIFSNALGSFDGLYWDTLTLPILIPGGASGLTVQVFSRDDLYSGLLPASLEWVVGALSVPTTPPPGTGTPGFWKNHPDAWPVASLTIGGKIYSKDLAIQIMKTSGSGDKCFTMFDALVSAKLNVLVGNPSACIDAKIVNADAWMNQWCVNEPFDFYMDGVKTVAGSSLPWKQTGESLSGTLDDYNNGLLCAPHRN